MNLPRTLFDKLWEPHVVSALPGGTSLIAIDRIFLHERTGAAALRSLAEAGRTIVDPARVFAVVDHIVDTMPGRGDQTLMPGGQAFITETRAAAQAAGIQFIDVNDARQGITHVIGPELGIALPGVTLIAPDSHTCTQGAIGALAWGIGSSDAEHAMATGTLRMQRPKTMRVSFTGRLSPGVTPKDMALGLIAKHGSGGGAGAAIEFAGHAVEALEVEGRLTLCNMATEFGAITAFVAPDEKVFDYLHGREFAPSGALWDLAISHWSTLRSAEDAVFDQEYALDAGAIAPMISWGTNPQASIPIDRHVPEDADRRALDYMALEPGRSLLGLTIDAAFIGSCTNSRLSDLQRAAEILRGRKVAPGVKALCVPGSTAVKCAAEAEGLDRVFVEAGFEWRESGCSMCFYAGGESFAPGSRVVSSTNRNFEGRQGPGIRTHIASPETVAASALAGAVADPRGYAK